MHSNDDRSDRRRRKKKKILKSRKRGRKEKKEEFKFNFEWCCLTQHAAPSDLPVFFFLLCGCLSVLFFFLFYQMKIYVFFFSSIFSYQSFLFLPFFNVLSTLCRNLRVQPFAPCNLSRSVMDPESAASFFFFSFLYS